MASAEAAPRRRKRRDRSASDQRTGVDYPRWYWPAFTATGLIWLVVMMAQVAIKDFMPSVQRRLLCFALFWHALDIIWVGLFTVVYLMGVSP